MAKATATVKVTKEVVVCDRCKKAKSTDALPLKIEYAGEVKTPASYNVCATCSTVIIGGITKINRRSTKKPQGATAAPSTPGATAGTATAAGTEI